MAEICFENKSGGGETGGGDSPRERDREVGEGDGETWDIGMSGTMTCTVAIDNNTDRQCRAKNWWVTCAGVDGWMEMWVRWWTGHYFLVKKRHVGQVTNRGEADRTQKRDVGYVMVRRRKMGAFFGICWLGDSQER